tara:strand:+ start:286 stop:666 length:381 start_codon:yes stop_codon:yes gene_type:complete
MKLLIFTLLLTIPFFSLSQNISDTDINGTGWKITYDNGSKQILLFEDDGTFTFLNVLMSDNHNEGNVYNREDELWELKEENQIVILFSNGYRILSGTINKSVDYISGTSINKSGQVNSWYGELVKF